MTCGCSKATNNEYVWTKTVDGTTQEIVYTSEIQAKAKVLRAGGSYSTRPKG